MTHTFIRYSLCLFVSILFANVNASLHFPCVEVKMHHLRSCPQLPSILNQSTIIYHHRYLHVLITLGVVELNGNSIVVSSASSVNITEFNYSYQSYAIKRIPLHPAVFDFSVLCSQQNNTNVYHSSLILIFSDFVLCTYFHCDTFFNFGSLRCCFLFFFKYICDMEYKWDLTAKHCVLVRFFISLVIICNECRP